MTDGCPLQVCKRRDSPVMKTENVALRYRREAAKCELSAGTATNRADQEAWERLAEDWRELARAAEANSFMERLQVG